jgi:hypothetical protein
MPAEDHKFASRRAGKYSKPFCEQYITRSRRLRLARAGPMLGAFEAQSSRLSHSLTTNVTGEVERA